MSNLAAAIYRAFGRGRTAALRATRRRLCARHHAAHAAYLLHAALAPKAEPGPRAASVRPLDFGPRSPSVCRADEPTSRVEDDVRTQQAVRPRRGRRARPGRGRAGRGATPGRRSPRPRTLDELKAARLAHQGEKSPLALANREIGALPPSAKAEAGKRVGQARGPGVAGARRPPGRARGRARPAHPRRGDRRRHGARPAAAAGCPAPDQPGLRAGRGHLRLDGLGDRRGPRGRVGVADLRRPQHPGRPPGPPGAGHLLRRAGRLRAGPAHPHLAGAGPHHARPRAADLRRCARARCSAPTTSTRRTPRSSTSSRAWSSTRASRWPTSRARSTRSSSGCSARAS